MKRIAVEEHFSTQEYIDYIRSRKVYPKMGGVEDKNHKKIEAVWFSPDFYMPNSPVFASRLIDVAEGRLKEMDEAGIDMQALSVSVPGPDAFDATTGTALARKLNDELYKLIAKYPQRFVGLAALAPQDPKGAADELERTVKELGFKGTKLN